MSLKEKLKQLPQKPGVYMMLDSSENIIYVGKAKNLKNRVSQYFTKQKDRAPKVAEMIQNIHTFNYFVTDTELDALIEECRLIKEIKPRYNRQMKNDRRHCYIKIPAEAFPKIAIVQDKKDDQALYFGPFTSPHRVETTVQFLKDFFPIRKCPTPGLVKRANGCLFRQLGTCLGVCTGQVDPEEYSLHIERIRQLLNGKDGVVLQELLKKQEAAVENLDFEKAAQYREYYLGLRHVIGKQRLLKSSNRKRNILAVEFMDHRFMKFFFIKGNQLLSSKVFDINAVEQKELSQELKWMIRENFEVKNDVKSDLLHKLNQFDIDEAQIITSHLKKNRDRIMSFWIPSSRLKRDTLDLEDIITKVITECLL